MRPTLPQLSEKKTSATDLSKSCYTAANKVVAELTVGGKLRRGLSRMDGGAADVVLQEAGSARWSQKITDGLLTNGRFVVPKKKQHMLREQLRKVRAARIVILVYT